MADYTSSTVAGYDACIQTLRLTDRTVWQLPDAVAVPEQIAAGERVVITFRSNADNGWDKIYGIARDGN